MATDLEQLRDDFDVETNWLVSADKVPTYLAAGVAIYNAMGAQEFELTVTGLDRDATSKEKRALVLAGVLAYLNGTLLEMSQNAIVASNAAGRTDLREVAKQMAARRKEIAAQLADVVTELSGGALLNEIAIRELGETLRVCDGGTWEGP